MFDRYNESARRTLFFARDEAFRLRSRTMEPEHLLLGLVRDGDEPVGELVARVCDTLDGLREAIEVRGAQSQSRPTFWTRWLGTPSTPHEIPFGPGCKLALRHAAEEADRLRHSDIRPGHLLLGILQDARSVASTMLSERGVQLEAARGALLGGPR